MPCDSAIFGSMTIISVFFFLFSFCFFGSDSVWFLFHLCALDRMKNVCFLWCVEAQSHIVKSQLYLHRHVYRHWNLSCRTLSHTHTQCMSSVGCMDTKSNQKKICQLVGGSLVENLLAPVALNFRHISIHIPCWFCSHLQWIFLVGSSPGRANALCAARRKKNERNNHHVNNPATAIVTWIKRQSYVSSPLQSTSPSLHPPSHTDVILYYMSAHDQSKQI